MPYFVKFPTDSASVYQRKKDFYAIAQFPKVVGAIDCTHVRIKCPTKKLGAEAAGHYYNRKGYHSINVQASKLC